MAGFDFKDFFERARQHGNQDLIPKAAKALEQFAAHVIGDAQQLCPVLTGFLQASGTWEPAEVKGDSITVVIGFNAIYAAAVHENLTARHLVGQAKYLESAIQANAPKLPGWMESNVGSG